MTVMRVILIVASCLVAAAYIAGAAGIGAAGGLLLRARASGRRVTCYGLLLLAIGCFLLGYAGAKMFCECLRICLRERIAVVIVAFERPRTRGRVYPGRVAQGKFTERAWDGSQQGADMTRTKAILPARGVRCSFAVTSILAVLMFAGVAVAAAAGGKTR